MSSLFSKSPDRSRSDEEMAFKVRANGPIISLVMKKLELLQLVMKQNYAKVFGVLPIFKHPKQSFWSSVYTNR